jgi:hypothetical protein
VLGRYGGCLQIICWTYVGLQREDTTSDVTEGLKAAGLLKRPRAIASPWHRFLVVCTFHGVLAAREYDSLAEFQEEDSHYPYREAMHLICRKQRSGMTTADIQEVRDRSTCCSVFNKDTDVPESLRDRDDIPEMKEPVDGLDCNGYRTGHVYNRLHKQLGLREEERKQLTTSYLMNQ